VPVLQLSQFKDRTGWLMLTGDHGLELWNYDQTSPKDVLQTAYEGIACAVSEKEQLFAIADRRGVIHLISEEDQGQQGVLQTDSDLVTDLCFVPASHLLAAAYRSGAVRLWDTRELNVVKEYRYGVSPATSLLASRDTRHLIAAMQDGNVNIWKLP
jgi:WD40 repeat protein